MCFSLPKPQSARKPHGYIRGVVADSSTDANSVRESLEDVAFDAVSAGGPFLVAALAPMMGPDLGIGPSVLGGAVGAGFAVAALLSPWAGKLVDRWGPRRCTVGLLLLVAVALGLLAVSRGGVGLALALVVNGFPQALANPATNKVILVSVPATRRSGVIGWKQSGVQMGALVAGLPLVWMAMWLGWRVAFVVAAVVAILLAV